MYSEYIEIINSNSASFAPETALPQEIPQNLVKKHITLRHIVQVYFVFKEFSSLGKDIPKGLERCSSIHAL